MRSAVSRARIASIAALFAAACDLGGAGDPPPRGGLYFPSALEISGDDDGDGKPDHLFVANSNYDLRYKSGSVQAIDLEAVDAVITKCETGETEEENGLPYCDKKHTACREQCKLPDAAISTNDAGVACGRCVNRDSCAEPADAGEANDQACDDCFDRCDEELEACHAEIPYDDNKCFVDPTSTKVFAGDAPVGSFATALSLSADAKALLVATRTDDELTIVPLRSGEDVIDCDSGKPACEKSRRPPESSDALPRWPGDPTDVLAGPMSDWSGVGSLGPVPSGNYALVAHRRGAVSLFIDESGKGKYVLAHTLEHFPGGFVGSVQITDMARDPGTGLVHTTMTFSVAGATTFGLTLGRLGVEVPTGDGPLAERARLFDAGLLRLDGIAGQTSTRALAFVDEIEDPSGVVSGPRALVVAESPTSLVFVDVDPADNEPGLARVSRVTEVGQGAARIVAGTLGTPGTPDAVQVALVSCFDSREVFVIDLATGLARSVVRNLSGPFDIALDGPRARLYVADFRSSILRVLDLASVMRAGADGETTARLAATIGKPRIVQELR